LQTRVGGSHGDIYPGIVKGFAMEPLSISLPGLVEMLNVEFKKMPIHFVRKTAKGLIEGIRVYARGNEPDLRW
jgi:hypothetical protein